MRFQRGEFCKNWDFQCVNFFDKMWIFAPAWDPLGTPVKLQEFLPHVRLRLARQVDIHDPGPIVQCFKHGSDSIGGQPVGLQIERLQALILLQSTIQRGTSKIIDVAINGGKLDNVIIAFHSFEQLNELFFFDVLDIVQVEILELLIIGFDFLNGFGDISRVGRVGFVVLQRIGVGLHDEFL